MNKSRLTYTCAAGAALVVTAFWLPLPHRVYAPLETAPRNVPVLDSLLILFVSAYGGRYQEEELVKHGGNKLISKPVNFIELTSAITFFHLDRARSGR